MMRPPETPRGPQRRQLVGGEDWVASEYVCRSGPDDAPFEERHGWFAIVAVAEGSFRYRTDCGEALLYPGSIMLGNAAACYECGHEHGVGDRCVSVQYAPALFEEIAASAARSHRERFAAAMLPALPTLAAPTVAVQRLASGGADPAAAEEATIAFAEHALAAVSGVTPSRRGPAAADARRVSAVLRHVEAHADSSLDLSGMAALARMSRYHFLRTFRRCTGVTPYRYLLELRLRRAAARLTETAEPVAVIAFDAGFGDLSTFNARFRETFAATPTTYRRRHGAKGG